MSLPLLNVFYPPYEIWSKRKLTKDERDSGKFNMCEITDGIDDMLEKAISTPVEAAIHMVEKGVDGGLDYFISNKIDNSHVFEEWCDLMPTSVPDNIEKYQNLFPNCDFKMVSEEINKVGCLPSVGQSFFHGGYLFDEGVLGFKTSKPLSTTLCPQVALRVAEHNGKAYDKGEIHLYVINVINPKTKAYVFQSEDSDLRHEKEILFCSGAHLGFIRKTLITESYSVYKYECPSKDIPAYVVEITIS